MNIAIITGGACVDACVFDSMDTAREFLEAGVWPGADDVTELPEGYGIGDSYDAATREWSKAPAPAEPEPAPSEPTIEERLASAEAENRRQAAVIEAQTQSMSMLEDCIVEMAGVVYA